jgi:hypothetical protein
MKHEHGKFILGDERGGHIVMKEVPLTGEWLATYRVGYDVRWPAGFGRTGYEAAANMWRLQDIKITTSTEG